MTPTCEGEWEVDDGPEPVEVWEAGAPGTVVFVDDPVGGGTGEYVEDVV